jgi:hypothetical protein
VTDLDVAISGRVRDVTAGRTNPSPCYCLPRISCNCPDCRRGANPSDAGCLGGADVSACWSPREPRCSGRWHSRRCERAVRGRGIRRDLQVDGRRGALDAHLRRSDRCLDRCPRRGTLGSQRGLGGDGRSFHPRKHLHWQWRIQVDRCRQNVDAFGSRCHRPHRKSRDSSDGPRHRLRGGHGPLLRPATRARRVPHARRRKDLGPRPLRRRAHRRYRHRRGTVQPANPLRLHLAAHYPALGP